MKKRIAIALAVLLVLTAAAGCGNKAVNKTNTSGSTNQTDASGAYQNGASGGEGAAEVAGTEDYSPEQVDMNKIEGEELNSDSGKSEYKGELGNAEVTIGDAKLIEYNGEDVAVVSFEYTNNSSTAMPFNGSLRVNATQDDNRLTPTVVTGVEGITMMALTENVEKGDTITVQMAYRLRDTSTPLVIEVTEFDMANATSEGLTKTFEF